LAVSCTLRVYGLLRKKGFLRIFARHVQTFATPYSLRFPRIQKIRYDKPWYDCLDVQSKLLLHHVVNHMNNYRVTC
jgi:hypothetical protein